MTQGACGSVAVSHIYAKCSITKQLCQWSICIHHLNIHLILMTGFLYNTEERLTSCRHRGSVGKKHINLSVGFFSSCMLVPHWPPCTGDRFLKTPVEMERCGSVCWCLGLQSTQFLCCQDHNTHNTSARLWMPGPWYNDASDTYCSQGYNARPSWKPTVHMNTKSMNNCFLWTCVFLCVCF